MKRREFLACVGAFPLAGCAILKPFVVRPEFQIQDDSSIVHVPRSYCRFYRTVVDYSGHDSDDFGYLYRRVVLHPDVCPQFVGEAVMTPQGTLWVGCYDIDSYGLKDDHRLKSVFERNARFMKRADGVHYFDTEKRKHIPVYWAELPREEWAVEQYDGCGELVCTITADSYC